MDSDMVKNQLFLFRILVGWEFARHNNPPDTPDIYGTMDSWVAKLRKDLLVVQRLESRPTNLEVICSNFAGS